MSNDSPMREEQGQRVPPPRVPPVGVGTATPEPPGRSPRRPVTRFARCRNWLGVAALLIVVGLGGIVLGRTPEQRAVGGTFIAFGVGALGLRLWMAVAPVINLRRRTRWIRARQAAIGPRRDHPPNDR